MGPAIYVDDSGEEHRLADILNSATDSDTFRNELKEAMGKVIQMLKFEVQDNKLLVAGDLDRATGLMRRTVVRACEREIDSAKP